MQSAASNKNKLGRLWIYPGHPSEGMCENHWDLSLWANQWEKLEPCRRPLSSSIQRTGVYPLSVTTQYPATLGVSWWADHSNPIRVKEKSCLRDEMGFTPLKKKEANFIVNMRFSVSILNDTLWSVITPKYIMTISTSAPSAVSDRLDAVWEQHILLTPA